MNKTESVLIERELRKITYDLSRVQELVTSLAQDIQGSASLYGRKSKIKGPRTNTHAAEVHSTGTASGQKAASVGSDK